MTEQAEGTALTVFGAETPLAVLQDSEKYGAFYARIKKEMDAFVPDVTTPKGRAEIASQAFKVTKTKTAIDDARKLLTEDARKLVEKANAAGKVIRDQLDELAKEVRRPLTEWEAAEEARRARVESTIELIKSLAVVPIGTPSGYIGDRLTQASELVITDDEFQERAHFAQAQREATVAALTTLLAQAQQAERDAEELERLREESRQREAREQAQRDEQARLQREADQKAAQEKADAEAKAAEEKRKADAKAAEEKRIADAEAKARQEAIDKAAREQEEREARHAKEIADRDAEIERQRQEREAEEKRKADEQAEADRRAKNRAHKSKLMGESKVALMTCGVTEDQARAIVTAIVAGMIPHIKMEF